jgi:hypothetical protein
LSNICDPAKDAPLGQVLALPVKYQTSLGRDWQSNLFCVFIDDEEKKFYGIDQWTIFFKFGNLSSTKVPVKKI